MLSFHEMDVVVENWKKWRNFALAGALAGAAAAKLGGPVYKDVPSPELKRPAQVAAAPPSFEPIVTTTPTKKPKQVVDAEIDSIGNYISGHEGSKKNPYKDGKGFTTYGIGHLKHPKDAELFRKLFGNKYDYEKFLKGEQPLDPQDIKTLFRHDFQGDRAAVARRLMPRFDDYPLDVRSAILDGVYRGDLSGSRKTIALINNGTPADWEKAAVEYLDNAEYRTAVTQRKAGRGPIAGVAGRMEQNAEAFKNYAKHLAAKEKSLEEFD